MLATVRALLLKRAAARDLKERPDWLLLDIGLDYTDIDRSVRTGR
jgi:hypothetical protein